MHEHKATVQGDGEIHSEEWVEINDIISKHKKYSRIRRIMLRASLSNRVGSEYGCIHFEPKI